MTRPHQNEFPGQAALDKFADWRARVPLVARPQVVRKLHAGSAHTTYELRAKTEQGECRLVLRCPSPGKNSLGTPFANEVTCMQLAAQAGLAPAVFWCDTEAQIVAMDFAEEHTTEHAQALATLVRSIHQLPAEAPRICLLAQLDHYAGVANQRGVNGSLLIDSFDNRVGSAIDRLEQEDRVFCHNDLIPDNIRWYQGQLVAIDWEYAGMGSPYFDVAALCAGYPGLDTDDFVKQVLGTRFSNQLWQLARHIYDAIHWNWLWAAGYKPRSAGNNRGEKEVRQQLLQNLEASL